jgi:hypothetical protein
MCMDTANVTTTPKKEYGCENETFEEGKTSD